MVSVSKWDNKYHVEGVVDLGLSERAVSVLRVGKNDYLAFRTDGCSTVRIGPMALDGMVRDLSSGYTEKMGFLLGYMHAGSPVFVRYVSPDWITRREGGVSYRRKTYLRYLRKANSTGFEVQADVHNHAYENLYEVNVEDAARTLPVDKLLRHGLFSSLESSAGFTITDIRDSRTGHCAVREKTSFKRSFSGVFERFRLGFGNTRVMTLHIASGPYMEHRHGIVASEIS